MDLLSLCASWFLPLPQDNWKLRLASGVVIVLLAWSGRRKCASLWTSAEYLGLAIGYSLGFRVGYPLFQVIKLVVSLLFFLVEFFFSPNRKQWKPLEYLLGFASDNLHSAIAVGGQHYHYAFPRGTGTVNKDDVDSSFNLSVQKINGRPHAYVRRTVGRTLLQDVDEKRLEMSGRCHDWASNALYALSADKFLTRGALLHLRWLTWVLIFLEVLLVITDLPYVTIGYTGEVGLLLCSLFDSLNLNKEKVDENLEMTASLQRRIYHGLLKYVFIVLGCVVAHVFLPAGYRGWDLLLLVLVSIASSLVVHYVLSSPMAPISAPSTDNESSHTDEGYAKKVD